ncbi:MAG: DUF1385 domain-containing protein [Clostridia bacterium]|nr:DUF1385 domain-containing protein [Clostridia bacterium]
MGKGCNNACPKVSVGGQALIEGIMMKGPKGTALSVRLPNNEIETEYRDVVPFTLRHKWLNIPVIRGVVAFADSMVEGYKCLMDSAEKSGMDLEETEESKVEKFLKKGLGKAFMPIICLIVIIFALAAAAGIYVLASGLVTKQSGFLFAGTIAGVVVCGVLFLYFGLIALANVGGAAFKNAIGIISMFLGLALSIFLFVYLPSFAFDLVDDYIFVNRDISSWKPFFEGFLKVAIFVLYIFLVSRMKEIKRLFMYHGAEHKTIFCYEHGQELTVENVRKESRFHPRCGTSFLLISILVGIFVAIVISRIFPTLTQNRALWVIVKLLMVPIIMGIGYEFIKLAGKHDNKFTRALSQPGLWMQRLTTKEPEDDMIEVAIASVLAVIPNDNEVSDEEIVDSDVVENSENE